MYLVKSSPDFSVDDGVDVQGEWVEVARSAILASPAGTVMKATGILHGTRTATGVTEMRTRLHSAVGTGATVRGEATTSADTAVPPSAPQLLNLNAGTIVGGVAGSSLYATLELRGYPHIAMPNIANITPSLTATGYLNVYLTSTANFVSTGTVCITGVAPEVAWRCQW